MLMMIPLKILQDRIMHQSKKHPPRPTLESENDLSIRYLRKATN